MKKYNVQPRIYDGGKKFEGYPDRYSVYFPMPKRFRADKEDDKGIYLGCTPTEDGMIRCTWEPVEAHDHIGYTIKLGRVVKLETFPKAFQRIIKRMTRIYNRALNENTDKAWKAWELC